MTTTPRRTGFGTNEWLVDELYQQYLADRNAVDPAWWDFFADYSPAESDTTTTSAVASSAAASNGGATATNATAAAAAPTVASTPHDMRHVTELLTPVGSPAAAPAASPAAYPAPATPAPATPAPATPAPATPAPATPAPVAAPAPIAAPIAAPAAPPVAAPVAAPPPPAGGQPTSKPVASVQAPTSLSHPSGAQVLRGPAARVVTNMAASLGVPTATSVRAVPAKLLVDNRTVINNHLSRRRGGKVSFTHLIGYAVIRAAVDLPSMNCSFGELDGKPAVVWPEHVNLGLAIDISRPDGNRQLLVPCIKATETMDFARFWAAYEDLVKKARANSLTVDDFAGTTMSLTNPGTIGTVHSVPRLMPGQGVIVGVGAMEYPAEWQGASDETIARNAVSKILTLTSTYDHRVIQGAQSGEFLRRVHQLLLGEDGFYEDIFRSLRVPYEPIRWTRDITVSHDDDVNKTARVQEIIHAFRVRGHLMADTDPLEYRQRQHPDLDVQSHGLTLWDLDREFATGGFGGKSFMKLRDILGVLRDSYCRTIGVEYMHIQDPEQRAWIQERIERPVPRMDAGRQLRILRRLNAAEAFENFLQTKYVGQKRFSLEGAEAVIPLLHGIMGPAARAGLDEVCIGMPHRGRLNVLANVVGKPVGRIFGEFEGYTDPDSAHGSGDVKYHLGAEGSFTEHRGSRIGVSLVANPSHLEAVNPVLEGFVRAKQDILDKGHNAFTVLAVLMHGDAAFAGQGVVAETLQQSQLRGYRTGGTIHVIVNNQVGFTTAPEHSRSSVYSSDVARMIQAPVFHVNGDDPEACVRVANLAFAFRQQFHIDVVIDMVCYRKRGHNEADDPSLTQPVMYRLIDAKRSVRKLYMEGLVGRGDITVSDAEEALKDYREKLEQVWAEVREVTSAPRVVKPAETPTPAYTEVDTAISPETVKTIVDSQVTLPLGFTVHTRLAPQLQRRAQMVMDGTIDWAMGETLAFGSLLLQGRTVRLSGQDSRRGTFGQRHAAIVDSVTGESYLPLKHLSADQGNFHVYDSLLSEFAAMGFEYGYSVARPEALVLWEAQFGDFANGAQTIIDEFISAGEQKWSQTSGVVLLLPHGYEGQGPDHSSARPERFLQMCAQDNMVVSMPSSPSSYFHLLRRHALDLVHKPLVVFSPKSMLRLKAAASRVEEFTTGRFRPVISDASVDPAAVRRVVMSAGKVHYDLLAARTAAGDTSTALLRVEQLYPIPAEELRVELARFGEVELIWAQEEPANYGGWPTMGLHLATMLGHHVRVAARPASSSPAVGSGQAHERELKALLSGVFPAAGSANAGAVAQPVS